MENQAKSENSGLSSSLPNLMFAYFVNRSQHKYKPNILGQDVHPREVDRDPPFPSVKLSREFRIGVVFVVNQYGGDEAPQHERCEQRGHPVESKKRFASEIDGNPSVLTNVTFDVFVLRIIVESLLFMSCFRHIYRI